MRNGWILQVSVGVLFAIGCAASAEEPGSLAGAATCEPQMPYECACANGQMGTQLCDASGTVLSECTCGSGAPGTGGFPPGTTGGFPASTGGLPSTGGTPTTGTGGLTPPGTGGLPPEMGTGGLPPEMGTGGLPPEMGTGGAPPISGGTCCSDGDCLCHGPDPSGLTSRNGTFGTANYRGSTGTIYYPTNAEPPFAGIALCGGFTNTGPEMAPWGPFYASHGIVTIITTTGGGDLPDLRGTKLLASIAELKAENTKNGSPLFGKMAGRYGTSGYSMGGGGTTLASRQDATLRTSVGLAAWAPNGSGVQVPTLLLCGASDGIAPCSGSQSAYNQIPNSTPKMITSIPGTSHLAWFGPTNAGGGISGETALAFQKVFLEGDERWKPLLLQSRGTKTTNIQ